MHSTPPFGFFTGKYLALLFFSRAAREAIKTSRPYPSLLPQRSRDTRGQNVQKWTRVTPCGLAFINSNPKGSPSQFFCLSSCGVCMKGTFRSSAVTTVLALLLLHALSAAAPPDAADTASASASAASWMPRVEVEEGGGGGGGDTSRDPYGILPEGPAADEEKECAHLAGRMLLCIADYEARHMPTREEGGRGGGGENTTLAQLQSQEKEREICKDMGMEHWKCVNRQGSSSLFGGYTRIRRVRHGYMCFSPFDIYFAVALELYGEWGQDEATVMTSFISPGDTVVEIGGHIGTLTLPLAKKVGPTGKCIVFEPQVLQFHFNFPRTVRAIQLVHVQVMGQMTPMCRVFHSNARPLCLDRLPN